MEKNGKNSKNLKIKKFLLFEVFTTHKKKRKKKFYSKLLFKKNHKLPYNLKSINNSSNIRIIVQPQIPKSKILLFPPYNIK